jgi:hypothetical protein
MCAWLVKSAVVPLVVLYTNLYDPTDGRHRLEEFGKKGSQKRDLLLTILWLLKYVGYMKDTDGDVDL